MVSSLTAALIVLSLLLALWALVAAALDRPPGRAHLLGLAALEVLLVVQVVLALVRLALGERPDSLGAFVGYCAVVVFVLPLGLLWSLEERTRWSTVVLAAACLTAAVMVLRLQQIWATVGG